MHLNDAIGRAIGACIYVCCHHEQACAMAADSYFRLSNRLAAVNVTTGPGGTNAITGRLRRLDRLARDGRRLGPGQVGDPRPEHRSAAPPARRPGSRHHQAWSSRSPSTRCSSPTRELDPLPPGTGQSTWRGPAAPARSGSTCRSTSRGRSSSTSMTLPGYDPLPRTGSDVRDPEAARVDAACREVRRAPHGGRAAGHHGRFGRADLGGPRRIPPARRPSWVFRSSRRPGTPTTSSGTTTRCYVGRPGTIGDRAGNFAVQNCRLPAGPGLPAQHPPGQLRLEEVRPSRLQSHGRRRRGRAEEADALDRPADPRRPSGRCSSPASLMGRGPAIAVGRTGAGLARLVPRAHSAVSGRPAGILGRPQAGM